MIKVFFAGRSLIEDSYIANGMKSGMEVDGISVFGNFSGIKINAFAPAVNYCRRMLLLGALEKTESALNIDADWERQLDVLFRSDKRSRKFMKTYIKNVDEEALYIFLTAAFEGMLRKDGAGLEECGKCFVDIASLSNSSTIGKLASRAFELLPCIRSNNIATRFIAAQAFGILAAHPASDDESVQNLIQNLLLEIKLWSSAVGAEANKVHGSILALGNLLSRASYYNRSEIFNDPAIATSVAQILEILEGARDSSTKEAVLNAVCQISASVVLTPSRIESSSLKVEGIIKILAAEAKKGNEKAITALGRLAIVFDDLPDGKTEGPLNSVLTSLYDLHELKQAETHFTIGEALSCVSACWESDALQLSLDVDTNYQGRQKRSATLIQLLDKLLKDCKTTKPSLKKASGIWLFSLIQNCGHLDEIQARLRESQGAFMGLLSARDELVQETASRGLSLVYEQGDKELREKLVKDLVASFTGTSAQLKVHEETELFEPGALPTGEGKSITSYKDIIELANEVGDQSLVYRFMSLAANAATWSIRAAFGRFGLSNILSESEVDPKLYPKLYRYRFDPNPNVQRSMNDIWTALVKDPSATINQYFDEILTDLLVSILGKEWRTRQASCAAIADLIQGREFEKYENKLHDIWHVTFKVLDDIKLSVREAALALAMALTGILVRQVEAGTSSKHAQKMLKEVLPFLLSSQGLENPAKEVRGFATVTVLKLIKSGGKTLLPFIPDLVEQLLGLLSTLEMEGVDYLYLRAAHYNLTEAKIDNARTTAVSHSPLMEAIELCLDQLDEPTMKEFAPRLENVIKTTLGMPSKVGAASVLVSLATRHSFAFRPFADNFLKVVMDKAVLDRNNAVSAAYARAAGYMSRLGSDKAVLRLAAYSKGLYFHAEDESQRQISADTIYAVSKFATDRFNSLALDFLPFVFFAKHDFDKHVKEQFEKTWSENVGGSRSVILYSREINALSVERLESPKWVIKHAAALTIADVVTASGPQMSRTVAAYIWPALDKALALKTFDGKEKVLDAFVKFTKVGKSLWDSESSVRTQMKKIAIREAKRNNDTYRPHAFASLGEYSESRPDIDMFDEVCNIIQPILQDLTNEDKMDTSDDKTKTVDKTNETLTITSGVTTLFKAINIKFIDPSPLTHLPKLLEIVKSVLASPNTTVATRAALYERTKVLFDGLRKRTHTQDTSCYELALGFFTLLEIPSGSGSESVRTKRGEAAAEVVLALQSGVFGTHREGRDTCKESMKELVLEARKNERSPSVQNVIEKIIKAFEG